MIRDAFALITLVLGCATATDTCTGGARCNAAEVDVSVNLLQTAYVVHSDIRIETRPNATDVVHSEVRNETTVKETYVITEALEKQRKRKSPAQLTAEKLGSLKAVTFMFVSCGLAWAFYFSQKDLFPTDGVAYMCLIGASFACTSIAMSTVNKECVSLTGAPATLTAIQMFFTVVVTMAFSYREVVGADRKKVLYWCVVPVMYAAMLNSSLFGFQYLTLSLVTVFKNLAPLLTIFIEGLIMDAEHKPTVTAPVVASLLMMIVGAVVFSYGQGGSTAFGLFIIILNTCLAMADRLLQRRLLVSECKDMPLSACMTLNNTLGLIPTFAVAFAVHEVQDIQRHRKSWTDPATMVLIALSGVMGMGIGFFGLMVQKTMTATSFQVLQNAAKFGVVAMGVGIFGDHLDTPARIVGMSLSLLGSAAYGYVRASEQPQPKAQPLGGPKSAEDAAPTAK